MSSLIDNKITSLVPFSVVVRAEDCLTRQCSLAYLGAVGREEHPTAFGTFL